MADGAEGAANEIISLDIDISDIETKLDLLEASFKALGTTLPNIFTGIATQAQAAEAQIAGLTEAMRGLLAASNQLRGLALPSLFSSVELNNLRQANVQMELLAANTNRVAAASRNLAEAQKLGHNAGVSQVIIQESPTAGRKPSAPERRSQSVVYSEGYPPNSGPSQFPVQPGFEKRSTSSGGSQVIINESPQRSSNAPGPVFEEWRDAVRAPNQRNIVKGINPGAIIRKDNQDYYFKYYSDIKMAQNEAFAAEMFKIFGAAAPDMQAVKIPKSAFPYSLASQGLGSMVPGVAGKFIPGLKDVDSRDIIGFQDKLLGLHAIANNLDNHGGNVKEFPGGNIGQVDFGATFGFGAARELSEYYMREFKKNPIEALQNVGVNFHHSQSHSDQLAHLQGFVQEWEAKQGEIGQAIERHFPDINDQIWLRNMLDERMNGLKGAIAQMQGISPPPKQFAEGHKTFAKNLIERNPNIDPWEVYNGLYDRGVSDLNPILNDLKEDGYVRAGSRFLRPGDEQPRPDVFAQWRSAIGGEKSGGPTPGINPGGLIEHGGRKHYFKIYEDLEQAQMEAFHAGLYKLFGAEAPSMHPVQIPFEQLPFDWEKAQDNYYGKDFSEIFEGGPKTSDGRRMVPGIAGEFQSGLSGARGADIRQYQRDFYALHALTANTDLHEGNVLEWPHGGIGQVDFGIGLGWGAYGELNSHHERELLENPIDNFDQHGLDPGNELGRDEKIEKVKDFLAEWDQKQASIRELLNENFGVGTPENKKYADMLEARVAAMQKWVDRVENDSSFGHMRSERDYDYPTSSEELDSYHSGHFLYSNSGAAGGGGSPPRPPAPPTGGEPPDDFGFHGPINWGAFNKPVYQDELFNNPFQDLPLFDDRIKVGPKPYIDLNQHYIEEYEQAHHAAMEQAANINEYEKAEAFGVGPEAGIIQKLKLAAQDKLNAIYAPMFEKLGRQQAQIFEPETFKNAFANVSQLPDKTAANTILKQYANLGGSFGPLNLSEEENFHFNELLTQAENMTGRKRYVPKPQALTKGDELIAPLLDRSRWDAIVKNLVEKNAIEPAKAMTVETAKVLQAAQGARFYGGSQNLAAALNFSEEDKKLYDALRARAETAVGKFYEPAAAAARKPPETFNQDYWNQRVLNLDQEDLSKPEARQLLQRANYGGAQGKGKENFLKDLDFTGTTATVKDYEQALGRAENILSRHATNSKSWLTSQIGSMSTHIAQWAMFGLMIGGAQAALELFNSTMKKAGETQVQGVLFDAYKKSQKDAGSPVDTSGANDLFREGAKLAAIYGDEVNDVLQDLSLWYKRTGDLESASYMTAQALKFQMATGTDLEDTYRTLTALGSQLSGITFYNKDGQKTNFDLSKTADFLRLITAASVAAGAGLNQVNRNGIELHNSMNNSANVLAESTQKDAAALRSLGFNLNQIVALNAAVIQSVGNTGPLAEEAAEKVSRLAGGLAGLGDPAKNKALAKDGIDLSKLTTAQTTDAQGTTKGATVTVLEQLADVYDKLTPAEQKHLAVALAGTRQYETLTAILENLHKAKQIELEDQKNMSLEDTLAQKMSETYEQSVKRLQGAFEGLQISIGSGLIPTMTDFVNYLATTVIPFLDSLIPHIAAISQAMAGAAAGAFIGSRLGPWGTLAGGVIGGAAGAASGAVSDNERAQDALMGPGWAKKHEDAGKRGGSGLLGAPNYYSSDPEWQKQQAQLDAKVKANQAAIDRYNAANAEPQGNLPTDKFGHPITDPEHQQMAFVNRGAFRAAHSGDDMKYPWLKDKIAQDTTANPAVGRDVQEYLSEQAQERLKHLEQVTDSKQGKLAGESAASGAGMLKPWEELAARIQDAADAMRLLNEQANRFIKTADKDIKFLEKQGKSTGSYDLGSLNEDVAFANQQAEAIAKNDEKNAEVFDDIASSTYTKLKAAPAHSEEWRGYMRDYDAARQNAERLRGEAEQYRDSIEFRSNQYQNDRKDDALSQLKPYDEQLKLDTKAIQDERNPSTRLRDISKYQDDIQAKIDKLKALRGQMNQAGQADFDAQMDTLTGMRDDAKKQKEEAEKAIHALDVSIQDTSTSIQSRAFDDIAKVSGMDPAHVTYIKRLGEINNEKTKFDEEWGPDSDKWKTANEAQRQHILQIRESHDALMDLDAATAQYEERLEEIKNSGWYKGLETAFADLGNFFSQSIVDAIENKSGFDEIIDNFKAQISTLEQDKSNIEDWNKYNRTKTPMDRGNYALMMTEYDQRIAKEKELMAARENAQNNPPLFKKMTEDLTKQYTQQYAKSIMDNLLKIDNPNKEMQQWVQQYAETVKSQFVPGVTTLNDAVSKWVASNDKFITAIDGTGKYNDVTGQNADAMNNFSADMENAGGGGWGPGSDSVSSHVTGSGAVAQWLAGGSNQEASKGLLGMFQSLLGGKDIVSGIDLALSASNKGTAGTIGSGLDMLGSQLVANGAKNNNVGQQNIGYAADAIGNVVGGFSQSEDAGIGALAGAGIGMLGGPAGAALGSSLGGLVGGLFGPHYNATNNPDMFANSGFAQGVANAGGDANNGVGGAYTSATGLVKEDPTLMMKLGGDTEFQYLDQFVKAHPGGQGLSGASEQLWQQVNQLTAGGQAATVNHLHNGQVTVSDASGNALSGAQNWQDLLTNIQNLTQATYEFQSNVQGASQALMVFNQYGSGTGSMQYNWNIPGFEQNPNGYVQGSSASTPGITKAVNPGGTPALAPISKGTVTTLPGPTRAASPTIQVQSNIQVDGRTLARVVQAYQQQNANAGYTRIS